MSSKLRNIFAYLFGFGYFYSYGYFAYEKPNSSFVLD